MRRARPPLFLAPDRYRRRRLIDAARMLPVAGAFLLLLPMLWRPTPAGHNTAVEGLYLFGIWALLIVAARLFSGPLLLADGASAGDLDEDAADRGGDDGG